MMIKYNCFSLIFFYEVEQTNRSNSPGKREYLWDDDHNAYKSETRAIVLL